MNNYTITELLGTFPAQYGKVRVAFRVEGNPNQISGFFKTAPQVGDVLHGEIAQKGQYWNFSFPKLGGFGATAPSGDLLRIERKVDAVLTELQMLRGRGASSSDVDNSPFS